MFQFEALRMAVDAFISKYPTMDTIAARDAVSPTDATWASERELAKVAEFLFYDDPSEPRSSTRVLVERCLKELSSALLARVMGHIGWDAMFKTIYLTHHQTDDHRYLVNEVDVDRHHKTRVDRDYKTDANESSVKLVVRNNWRTQLVHNGPMCCHDD
jgi:hypothetical protein